MKQLNYIEIDKKAIAYNLKNIRSLLQPQTRLMVVVKSNAYGHGLVEFAQEAIKNKAEVLGVVNIEEALKLREAKIIKPILVLGYVPREKLNIAAKNHIEIALISQEQAIEIIHTKLEAKLKVHIKVETGIGRLGIQYKNLLSVYKELSRSRNIEIIGIYSHLASVEEHNLDYTTSQFKEFSKIIDMFKKYSIEIPIKHISASGGTLLFPESHFDMVRVGIAAYGLWPSKENKKVFLSENIDLPIPFLKPVLNYKSTIVQLKEINSGFVGYGCTYRIVRPTKIAVIPIGYFEGFDRGLSCANVKKITDTERTGCAEVIIKRKRCPIIGRICMNMSIVDVTKLKNDYLKVGDEVTIIGKDGKEQITVEEIAKKINTINYEIVSRLPEHIKRYYI